MENLQRAKLDWLKWLLVTVLLVAGLIANYYYSRQPWPLSFIAGLVVVGMMVAVIYQTTLGRRVWTFAKDSRMDLRKVVWPTRQETIQVTLLITVVVIVLALVLWGMDGILLRVIGWLTGQRG